MRDTRFSADTKPYKIHLGHAAWPDSGRERPRYFVRCQQERLILGSGMHLFSADAAVAEVGIEPRADLLSERLANLCLTHFQKHRPLLQWLVDLLPG